MGINISSIEILAQKINKCAKDCNVKSIFQQKPANLERVNFSELKLAPPLKKDIFETKVINKKAQIRLNANSTDYTDFESKMNTIINNFCKESLKNENKISVRFDNINEFKEKLKPILTESAFKPIESLKTSEDIFATLKNNFTWMNKFDSKERSTLIKLAKENGITPEIEKAYNKYLCEEAESYKKILRVINPKSKNSEVLKIEEELNNLGIKEVNFADDIEQARNVKEAVKNLIKAKIPLPDSITVSPFLPQGYGGMAIPGNGNNFVILSNSIINNNSKMINYIKTIPEFKNSPIEYQTKYLNLALNHQSTQNVSHNFYHEIGHLFQNSIKNENVQLSAAEKEISKSISTYGSSDINEFVPEVFAKLISGQQISKEQADLYLKLDGLLPKF